MANLFNNTKHVGTIGRSRAANCLDEILCEVNDVKLIAKISKILSFQQSESKAINSSIRHPKYRIVLLKKYRDDALGLLESVDLEKFNITKAQAKIISSLTKNAIITNYRIALRVS